MRNRYSKGNIIATVVSLAAVAMALLAIVNSSGAETTADALILKGLYGKKIPYSLITSSELYEADLPALMVKVNGIGLGFIEMGRYRLKDIGSARLYILKRQKPYLLLRTADETILVGLGAEKNRELLENIRKIGGRH